jgi:hypothetical protein
MFFKKLFMFGIVIVLSACQVPEDSNVPTDQFNLKSAVRLSYNLSNFEGLVNSSSIAAYPNISKAGFTFSVNPSLPAGIQLDRSTGVILGTPTVVSPPTVYTITATDGDETVATTLLIRVDGNIPDFIIYPGQRIEFTKDSAGTSGLPQTFTDVTNFSSTFNFAGVGLALNATTGEISGTPTTYYEGLVDITVTNPFGSYTQYFYLFIRDRIPSGLALTFNDQTVSIGTPITNMVASYSDATNASFSVTPSLPTGVTVNKATGEISGTPTQEIPDTTFTLYATNNEGTVTTTFDLEVLFGPASLAYPAITQSRYNPIVPIDPVITGGTPTAYTEDAPGCLAALGLTLNGINGKISGTVTAAPAVYTCDITASKGVLTAGATVTININFRLFGISYTTPQVVEIGDTILIEPSISGTTTNIQYSVLPALPAGLALDLNSGNITGTPTTVTADTAYTITATDTSDLSVAGSTILNLEVIDKAPGPLGYEDRYTFYTSLNIINALPNPDPSGGTPTSYAISPTLPLGMTFNTTTGEIAGTPSVPSDITIYSITATNATGSRIQTIQLEVIYSPPVKITYPSSTYTVNLFDVGFSATPTYVGPADATFSISPALPFGLTLDPATGEIAGTINSYIPLTRYTITAQNDFGRITTSIFITVNNTSPANLDYNGGGVVQVTRGQSFNITPTSNYNLLNNTGGQIVQYCLDGGSDPLPAGVALNEQTGALYGRAVNASIPGEFNTGYIQTNGASNLVIVGFNQEFADCTTALAAMNGTIDVTDTVTFYAVDSPPSFEYFNPETNSNKMIIPLGESLNLFPQRPTPYPTGVSTQENGGALATAMCSTDATGTTFFGTTLGGDYAIDPDNCSIVGQSTSGANCAAQDGQSAVFEVTGQNAGGSHTTEVEVLAMLYPGKYLSNTISIDGSSFGTESVRAYSGIAGCLATDATYSLSPSVPAGAFTFDTASGDITYNNPGLLVQSEYTFIGTRNAFGEIAQVNETIRLAAEYNSGSPDRVQFIHYDFNLDGLNDIALITDTGVDFGNLFLGLGDGYYASEITNELDIAGGQFGSLIIMDPVAVSYSSSTLGTSSAIMAINPSGPIIYANGILEDIAGTSVIFSPDPSPYYQLETLTRHHSNNLINNTEAYLLYRQNSTNQYRLIRYEVGTDAALTIADSFDINTDEIPYAAEVTDMKVADMNGDNYPDLVIAFDDIGTNSRSNICIINGISSDEFSETCTLNFTVSSTNVIEQIFLFDMIDTDDNLMELVALDSAGTMSVYRNDGEFNLTIVFTDTLDINSPLKSSGEPISFSDADDDGDYDILVVDHDQAALVVYKNTDGPTPFFNTTGNKVQFNNSIGTSLTDDVRSIYRVPISQSNGNIDYDGFLACSLRSGTTQRCFLKNPRLIVSP